MQQAPDFEFEEAMQRRGLKHIAGTDEAGRGPLAGPVVAAAVVLPRSLSQQASDDLAKLTDSKKLNEATRKALFDAICRHALCCSITSISAQTIDETDILSASLAAMRRAVLSMALPIDGVLVDGNKLIRDLPAEIRQQAIIKGDSRSLSIAAASILAKVTRDAMMAQLGSAHRGYGLESHKGYGSASHRSIMMEQGGVSRVHRFSFKPLRSDEKLI